MPKQVWISLIVLLVFRFGFAQSTYQQLASDTIIVSKKLMGNIYLLNGKKMNLPVMQWFMSDFPKSDELIRLAIVGEQLSWTSYCVGSMLFVSGLLIANNNPPFGREVATMGGISIGGGILFHLTADALKNKAVKHYNNSVKSIYKTKERAGLELGADFNGIKLSVTF